MRQVLAAVVVVSFLAASAAPVAASGVRAEARWLQVPDVRPFRTAHFGLAGSAKYDGITVDILGEGDLGLPDRQRSSFKFGPITVELIQIGDAFYTRSRFDRSWSRELFPEPISIGPISAIDLTSIERNVRLIGGETVGDTATEHYTTALDLRSTPQARLAVAVEPSVRPALESLQASVDVWVGATDRMVRQERIVLSLLLPSVEPGGEDVPATLDLTIVYSRLNQPVSIEQPNRTDRSPIQNPRPDVSPVAGPPGSPTGRAAPARAPVQIPGR